jgi:hypothetical protein
LGSGNAHDAGCRNGGEAAAGGGDKAAPAKIESKPSLHSPTARLRLIDIFVDFYDILSLADASKKAERV